MGLVKNTFLVLAMTQTTNLSLGNEPTGVAFPSDPLKYFHSVEHQNRLRLPYITKIYFL